MMKNIWRKAAVPGGRPFPIFRKLTESIVVNTAGSAMVDETEEKCDQRRTLLTG